jgi:serine/threonine protein kinase
VTPLAVRLDYHLTGRPPADAVSAVAQVAATLAEVHARGIAHRDIKPANLFWFKDRAHVGDLGLVAVPDTSTVAQDGMVPGAFGFIADELLVATDPSLLTISDWQSADVFALAKSLWALAAALSFAPQGHIAESDDASALRRRLVTDNAAELDRIIDNATLPAAARSDMRDLASELKTWMNRPDREPPPGDIEESLARLQAVMQSDFQARDARVLRDSAFEEATQTLIEESQDLATAILQVDPAAEVGPGAVGSLRQTTEFAEYIGGPQIEQTTHWGIRLTRADSGRHRILGSPLRLGVTRATLCPRISC